MSDQHHLLYGASRRRAEAYRCLSYMQAVYEALDRLEEAIGELGEPDDPEGCPTGFPALDGGPHPVLRTREGGNTPIPPHTP